MQTAIAQRHLGKDAACGTCGQLTWLRWTGLATCRDDPEHRHEPVFAIYCPTCAEGGFHPIPTLNAA